LSWLAQMEYSVFKVPKPDAVVYLDVPLERSLENLKKKKPELYKDGRVDQTENDIEYLKGSLDCARWLSTQDDDWHKIDCADGDKLRSIEEIHEDVYKVINNSYNKMNLNVKKLHPEAKTSFKGSPW
jgi:dTMP kinase